MTPLLYTKYGKRSIPGKSPGKFFSGIQISLAYMMGIDTIWVPLLAHFKNPKIHSMEQCTNRHWSSFFDARGPLKKLIGYLFNQPECMQIVLRPYIQRYSNQKVISMHPKKSLLLTTISSLHTNFRSIITFFWVHENQFLVNIPLDIWPKDCLDALRSIN